MNSIARQFLKLLTSKDVKKRNKYSVSEFPYTVNVLKQPNAKIGTNSVIEVTVKIQMVTLDKNANSSRFKRTCLLTTKYILSTG